MAKLHQDGQRLAILGGESIGAITTLGSNANTTFTSTGTALSVGS